MKDLVTVFTPVYNRKNLIGNLYQSLLSQTYKNFEWIIVDDGSTDDIDEIIKSYQNVRSYINSFHQTREWWKT